MSENYERTKTRRCRMTTAKDTVMSDEEQAKFIEFPIEGYTTDRQGLCVAQAEISWHEAMKSQAVPREEYLKEGRKEVVEFFEENNDFDEAPPCPYYIMNRKVWQSKLKEWG